MMMMSKTKNVSQPFVTTMMLLTASSLLTSLLSFWPSIKGGGTVHFVYANQEMCGKFLKRKESLRELRDDDRLYCGVVGQEDFFKAMACLSQ